MISSEYAGFSGCLFIYLNFVEIFLKNPLRFEFILHRDANGLDPGQNHGGSRPGSVFVDLVPDLTWNLGVVSRVANRYLIILGIQPRKMGLKLNLGFI